jgi:hypothetical protein
MIILLVDIPACLGNQRKHRRNTTEMYDCSDHAVVMNEVPKYRVCMIVVTMQL